MREWNAALPLFVSTFVETVQGEAARYARTGKGEVEVFGHFPRTWPFHYGCVPGLVSTGDESLVPGPESGAGDWLDAIICGGDAAPGGRLDARVVGIALRGDRDHKLLTVAVDDPEFQGAESHEDLPPEVCEAVVAWFEAMGVRHELADRRRAWATIEESLRAGEVPLNRYRASGGLVTHGKEVLLLARRERAEIRLPKGHVEPGESLLDTAVRETKEESGLRGIDPERFLGTVRNLFYHDDRLWVRDESYFHLRWRGKKQKSSERQFERQWVTPAEAAERLTFSAERHVVRTAFAK